MRKKKEKKKNQQNINNRLIVWKTISYEFIWILVLLLLKYGNFPNKCHITTLAAVMLIGGEQCF